VQLKLTIVQLAKQFPFVHTADMNIKISAGSLRLRCFDTKELSLHLQTTLLLSSSTLPSHTCHKQCLSFKISFLKYCMDLSCNTFAGILELYTYNLLSSATKLEIYHKNIRPRKIHVTCKEIKPGIPPPCSSKFYIVVKITLNDRTHLLDTFQRTDIKL
jgi:hypothetical protein